MRRFQWPWSRARPAGMPVDERLVIAGEELVRVNRRVAELQKDRDEYESAMAMADTELSKARRELQSLRSSVPLELAGSKAPEGRVERWYRDVAAEHLRTTARLPLKTQRKRLARLLKHMAYQPGRRGSDG